MFTALLGAIGGGQGYLGNLVATTGTDVTITLPPGTNYINAYMWGAGSSGAYSANAITAGEGGFIYGLIAVVGGSTYKYSVGAAGAVGTSGSSTNVGGSPAGGDGSNGNAGGSGKTYIYRDSISQANTDMVAGGAGGCGIHGGNSGSGGASTGESGGGGAGTNGTGGSQVSGGTSNGAALSGGDFPVGTANAGGGDGYYGGGAGQGGNGNAAGGSNYSSGNCSHVTSVRGKGSHANYPGSPVAIGGSNHATTPVAGGRGHLIIEFWAIDPYAAGLRS